jgi:hypothetical protein
MNIIRQRLYELDVAHEITNPRSDTRSFYELNGFTLHRGFPGGFPFNQQPAEITLVQRLKQEFQQTDYEIVFNTGQANRARSQRRQLLTKVLEDDYRRDYFDREVDTFLFNTERRVIQFAQRFLPAEHEILTTETLLFSVDGADVIQDPHCDLGDRHVGKALLAFVAIEPNTTIILYPGTHRILEDLDRDYPPKRYSLNVGDVLLFHPRLIHCGDRYLHSNLRLHYYIFAHPRLTWRNITFPLRNGELPLIQSTYNQVHHRDNRLVGRHNVRQRRLSLRDIRRRNALRARSHL